MSQLICGGCRTLLMYTRGASSVRCSCCHTVNLVPGIIDFFCMCILFSPSPAHIFSLPYLRCTNCLLLILVSLCLIHSFGSGCSCQLWQLSYNTNVSIWSSVSQMRRLSLRNERQCESVCFMFSVYQVG